MLRRSRVVLPMTLTKRPETRYNSYQKNVHIFRTRGTMMSLAQVKLPAQPVLQLNDDKEPVTFARPDVVKAQPSADVYRLPTDFQNADLSRPGEAPKSLGAIHTQPAADWSKGC